MSFFFFSLSLSPLLFFLLLPNMCFVTLHRNLRKLSSNHCTFLQSADGFFVIDGCFPVQSRCCKHPQCISFAFVLSFWADKVLCKPIELAESLVVCLLHGRHFDGSLLIKIDLKLKEMEPKEKKK